jgi:iron complex transport system substrate-binding protein
MTPTNLLRRLLLPGLLVFAVGLAALAPAAAGAQPIVVEDDHGVVHRLPAPPQRIVSMMPSLTETAWALGAGPRLVGVDRYSNWPAEVAALPHLGGLEDAQIEAIASLRPDLILASASSRAMDRLAALGFTVVRLKSDSHADLRRTLDLVARLLGRPDEGARLWARLQAQLDAAAARVPPDLRGRRVYFEIGGGPYAAGSTSFIGETLARLGLANIVPPELGPFPKLNPEYVVRARPDLIVGAQDDLRRLDRRPGWAALPAVQQRHVCGFEPAVYDILVRPGPRLGEAAELLADCLSRFDGAAPK